MLAILHLGACRQGAARAVAIHPGQAGSARRAG